MKLTFWLCLLLIAYAYFGYAIYLWIYVRLYKRPILQKPITPSVSIVIAAHNEEKNLPVKLENLRRLDYPGDLIQIVIASDGSTDSTPEILREQGSPVIPVILDAAHGKASALNEAVKHATGDVLVFLDTRQIIAPNAISELVACFADPEIGAVSGELVLETATGIPSENALGIYWTIEKIVRKLESASGSVVGVTGAIYAIRRDLYTNIPP